MPSPVAMLTQDAAETVRRIRRDAAHMRDLGKLAIAGIRATAERARIATERAIDQLADGVGDLSDAYHGRPRAPRGRHAGGR